MILFINNTPQVMIKFNIKKNDEISCPVFGK